MHIGLTYDLRDHYLELGYNTEEVAEFDYPETIDAIENALTANHFSVDRIGNVKDLSQRLINGERWDLVFNVAEGMHGIGREAQIPAILDAWNIPYTFSNPLTNTLTLHKAMTKRILRDHGLPVTPFVLIQDQAQLNQLNLDFPLMLKPLREGNSKGISPDSRVQSQSQLVKQCQHLLTRFKQPVLIEPFLPGREFTVGILGSGEATECVGVLEKLLGEEPVYFKYATGFPGRLVTDSEALEAENLAIAAWKALECQDGGRVDLRSDSAGKPMILEVNTLPGLRPNNSDLPVMCELAGISFTQLIRRIVDSALQRTNGKHL